MSRLIVVSNRVAPVRKRGSGAEGGLAIAIYAALKERGGIWFGWSGQISDQDSTQPNIFDVGKVTYATVDLSQRDYDEYYNGLANRTLWPLFHYRLDLSDFAQRNFAGYQRVNTLFATRLLPLLKDDDLIWVHDYHLIPLGEQLRAAGCGQRMGFFLHIPWPALEVVLALPNHRRIVRALCSYDLVGFQTINDLRAFHDYILHEAEGEVDADGVVRAFGRVLRADAFPIGIDTEAVAAFAKEAGRSRQTERLKDSLLDRDMMIGVDRLDYSKGLVSRMEAYEHLLTNYPANRGRVVLLQIAPPSRSDVPEYVDIRHELEATAGRINASFAEFDWNPIRYLNKGFTRQTLSGFLRISRIGLVTPLRDGMNLVAKEYVAAQPPEDPGVLILSRFAGAARQLDSALIVNPYDVEGVAEAMQVALAMPVEERRERWRPMFERLGREDVTAWREAFLDALTGPPNPA
ncbi:MAG: alpha,alpha-trehalose-phosphate synthase (UDP-forming) [Kiloniellales bacterium]|nr:alpha,alpha-trehalose-phosphate synthase (UDP-forming) [Kiloniellales bacterium]